MSTEQDVAAFVNFLDEVFVTGKSTATDGDYNLGQEEAGQISEQAGSGAICLPPAYSFG